MSNEGHHPSYVGTTRVFVESPRYGLSEISLITLQVSLFENISLPYITAQLVIIDSANASNAVHFQGQERVVIVVIDKDENIIFNKEFVCMGIEYGQKLGDDKSGFIVKLIEEHAMLSNSTRFSKVYEGKPDQICQTVCQEQLGVDVAPEGSVTQSEMRVVFPFTISPLEAANWMVSRCSTDEGMPFLFYSTLSEDALQLKDVKTLLNQDAFNNNDPYVFARTSSTSPGGTEDAAVLKKKIVNYSIPNNEDTLFAMIKNVYGGYYNFIDTYEFGGQEVKYDFTKPFGALPNKNGSTKYNYDPDFTIGRAFHEGQNTYTSQVATRKLFDDMYSFLEEEDVDMHLKKAESRGIYNFMDQQPINFAVNGIDLGFDKLGKCVDVYITKDIPAEEKVSPEQMKDKKRSGTYLIQKVMYTIFDNRLTSTVTATKTSTNSNLGGEKVNLV